MLDSAEVAARPFLFEFQQNLDNCIGESGKTKHLIEACLSRRDSGGEDE